MSIPIVITMILGYLLNYFIKDYSIINFILKGFIYTAIYGVLMWIMGLNMYEKKEILKPVRKILMR